MQTLVYSSPSLKSKPFPVTTNKAKKLITGDMLARMDDVDNTELINGEIVHHMPTSHRHSVIEATVAISIGAYLLDNRIGRVLTGETGVYTRRNPDSIRAMDAAYISNERYALVQSRSFLDVAPELIVEVMSPADRWSDVHEKIAEYFSINALELWIIDPRLEQVHVYTSPTQSKIYGVSDTITTDSILPNFTLPVGRLFE